MGASNCIFPFLFVALLPCLSAISWASTNSYTDEILTQCRHTRYPNLCVQTLTGLGSKNQNIDFLYALVNKTISETGLPRSNFVELSSHFISLEAQQAGMAIDDCQELTGMALRWLNQAKEAIRKSPEKYKEDIQTWLSSAISGCKNTSSLSFVFLGPGTMTLRNMYSSFIHIQGSKLYGVKIACHEEYR